MTRTVRLPQWVLFWQAMFTAGTGLLVAELGPRLLLLDPAVTPATSRLFFLLIGVGGLVAIIASAISLGRHQPLLRALSQRENVDPQALADLEREPWRSGLIWASPSLLAIGIAAGPLRPHLLNVRESISFGLLAASLVVAVTLLLITICRRNVVHALELAPTGAMHEVMLRAEKSGLARGLLPRRLSLAFAVPVAFVAFGAALIVNAHLRRADVLEREQTARALARAAFEEGRGIRANSGMVEARQNAKLRGFSVTLSGKPASYTVTRERDGVVSVTMPLDYGSARVRFRGSSVGVLAQDTLPVALLAVGIAALFGWLLGAALSWDLRAATQSVRLLGTETRLEAPHAMRFRGVEALSVSVTELARRFRVFARAQERAIAAQESAARARGLLFASVSHDLRSPLNAILGFTELARLEQVSKEQELSLDIIERRGRELLALIETILDSARLDANRLTLTQEALELRELLTEAVSKARDLAGDRELDVIIDAPPDMDRVVSVDVTRLSRALGMLIGHSMRSASRSPLELRAGQRDGQAVIELDVFSDQVSAHKLESLLGARKQPAVERHRGLALGLRLARTVIELHGGTVTVTQHLEPGARFVVTLPSVPNHEVPPPPVSSRRPPPRA